MWSSWNYSGDEIKQREFVELRESASSEPTLQLKVKSCSMRITTKNCPDYAMSIYRRYSRLRKTNHFDIHVVRCLQFCRTPENVLKPCWIASGIEKCVIERFEKCSKVRHLLSTTVIFGFQYWSCQLSACHCDTAQRSRSVIRCIHVEN